MAKANNFGVEGIKNGMTVVAGLVKTSFSADINGDGKIDGSERISFVTSFIPQAFPLLSIYPAAADEVKDKITNEEWDELVDYAQTLDFLPAGKDVAEKYVKRLFLWINYNRRFIADSIQLLSKREGVEIQLPTKVAKIAV